MTVKQRKNVKGGKSAKAEQALSNAELARTRGGRTDNDDPYERWGPGQVSFEPVSLTGPLVEA
jgi:hypothetical protein